MGLAEPHGSHDRSTRRLFVSEIPQHCGNCYVDSTGSCDVAKRESCRILDAVSIPDADGTPQPGLYKEDIV